MAHPRYAVFGHPIAHSRSPLIHAEFARQCGITLQYGAIDAPPDAFAAQLAHFHAEGGMGANVTLPLKQLAHDQAHSLSERARRAGSVNTLIRTQDGWHGDNTDGIGLVRDLVERHGLLLHDAVVMLLGAGGAAAGIAPALLDAGIATLHIANRSIDRAQTLAEHLGDTRVHAWPWHRAQDLQRVHLLINATAAARVAADTVWPAMVVTADTTAVDLGYGDAATSFLQAMRAGGAGRMIDGLGMLVEQAAESFTLWHGVHPDTQAVYAQLRAGA